MARGGEDVRVEGDLLGAGRVQDALLRHIGRRIAVEDGLLEIGVQVAHKRLVDERADDAVIVQFLVGDLEAVCAGPFLRLGHLRAELG